MENLSLEQTQYLDKYIGHTKFTELAKQLGCSVEAVRAYAPTVFAYRKAAEAEYQAKRDAEWKAKREAEIKKYLDGAEKLYKAGDLAGLRAYFLEENADEIWDHLDAKHNATSDIIDGMVDNYREELLNSDEVQEQFRELYEEEFNDTVEEQFEEFLSKLKG